MSIFYFSVTKGKKEDTLLFKNLSTYNSFFFKENNTDSLASCYNKAINFAKEEKVDHLVLCHDDIIIESDITYKIPDTMREFDVIGVAGASECKLAEPVLWHIMGGGIGSKNLHGAVSHGDEKKKFMSSFGVYPHRAIIIDGVFMVINRKVFNEIRFDEECPAKWHFYDIDYSLQCHKAGFKVGVSDIMITHSSPGLREYTSEFLEGQKWFLDKWKK